MQRELTFRAWDDKLKRWVIKGFDIFGETTLFDLIGQYCYENRGEDGSLMKYNDIIVTQFTGFVDKNGTKIYEGDIIASEFIEFNAPFPSGVLTYHMDKMSAPVQYINEEIIFKDGCWGVLSNCYKDKGKFSALAEYANIVEIVGNMFESPELIA